MEQQVISGRLTREKRECLMAYQCDTLLLRPPTNRDVHKSHCGRLRLALLCESGGKRKAGMSALTDASYGNTKLGRRPTVKDYPRAGVTPASRNPFPIRTCHAHRSYQSCATPLCHFSPTRQLRTQGCLVMRGD